MSNLTITQPSVGQALSERFYVIPAFQRAYEWEDSNTAELFKDILNHFREWEDNPGIDNYHLGSIICYKPAHQSFDEVIDGQQRLTSLLILMAAARDRCAELETKFPDWASKMLRDTDADDDGGDATKPRVTPHYADGRQFIAQLLAGNDIKHDDKLGESYKRLVDAYLSFKTHFRAFDEVTIKPFLKHIKERVSLICMITQSYTACFKLFESINARGKGLLPTDLVKNILFTKARDLEIETLKFKWDGLMKQFNGKSTDFMTFFRDYAISKTSSDEMKDDQLIEMFRNKKNSLEVIDDIIAKADWYGNFLQNRNHRAEKCEQLDRMSFLGNESFRIHYNLLFTVADKCPDHFDAFLDAIERHLVVYKVLGKYVPHLKGWFAEWRARVHDSETDEDIQAILEDMFHATLKYRESFVAELTHNTVSAKNKVIRYLLAKVYFEVDQVASHESGFMTFGALLRATKSHQVEHVLPQTYDIEAATESNIVEEDSYNQWKSRFGNLMILERSLNATIGKLPFSEKLQGYVASSLVLNRFTAEHLIDGSNNAFKRATNGFNVHKTWSADAIQDRGASYVAHVVRSFGLDSAPNPN